MERLDGRAHPVSRAAVVLLLAVGLTPAAARADPASEAAALRAKAIANVAGLTTLSLEDRVVTTPVGPGGELTGPGREEPESIAWSRSCGRLRRRHPAAPSSGYSVNAPARRLVLSRGASTRLDESLEDAHFDRLAVPQPAWLWRPDWLIPAKPAEVRVNAGILTVTTAVGNPRREIDLERSTGRILRVADTDATGRSVRLATCGDWRRVGSVWIPYRVVETVSGTAGGVRRTWTVTACTVNTPLSEADYALP